MQFSADDIRIFDDWVPEGLGNDLVELANAPIWFFGHRSNDRPESFSLWHTHFAGGGRSNRTSCEVELLNTAPKPIVELWLSLRRTILQGHEPLRVYGNASSYGVEGYTHQDSDDDPNYFTTLYYPHSHWERNWGGEILFFDDHEVIKAVSPRPGRLVQFPGAMYHRASGPSRVCDALRVSFMFKTRRKDDYGM